MYAETSIPLIPVIIDESGAIRDNVEYTFSTSKEDVAMIDAFNNLKLLKKGKSTITLSADGIETEIEVDVKENPVESLDLIHNYTEKTIRTGDVITFEATQKIVGGVLLKMYL